MVKAAQSERRNITLSMPVHMLRRARKVAAEKGLSLSGLMLQALQEMISRKHGYEEALCQETAIMKKGLPMNTMGKKIWTRDELHER